VSYRSLCDASQLKFNTGIGDPFADVQARHVMTTLVACLEQNETLGGAAEFFLRFRINSSPVVDEYGKLVGILSEKDVMSVMLSPDCWNRPIHQVMKTNVVCYQEQTPVKTIYDFLCRVTIRRVIIVNDGFPTGMVSRGTLLRWFNNWHAVFAPQQAARPIEDDQLRRQGALKHTSAALLNLSERLYEHLSGDEEAILPALVDSASRMQELINDLLSESRSFLQTSNDKSFAAPTNMPAAVEPAEAPTVSGVWAWAAEGTDPGDPSASS
jgi:CBS domain-containing protein